MRTFDWLSPIRTLRGLSQRRTTSQRSAWRRQAASRGRLFYVETLEERTLLAAWVSQGPALVTGGQSEGIVDRPVVGAVHAVAAHPGNADILYVGAANGGIWKTTNATAASPTWTAQTDSQPSLSIGALEFDPTDLGHQTLVAGFAQNSSFATVESEFRSIGGPRIGLLRTTNGGTSWTVIDGSGGVASGAIGAVTLVGKNISGVAARGNTLVVSVNTADDDQLANTGIFQSTDGGFIFKQISTGDGTATGLPHGAAFDLVRDPNATTVLYTAMVLGGSNGLYKSTTSGATWTKVSDATMDALIIDGTTNNIEIATSHAGGTDNVFVGIIQTGQLQGLFRSVDGGTSFTKLDTPITNEGGLSFGLQPRPHGDGTPGSQGATHFSIVADPMHANLVYVGGDSQPKSPGPDGLAKTDDDVFPNSLGATNFSGRLFRVNASLPMGMQAVALTHNQTASGHSAPHADSRDMVFDAMGRIIEVDDGGVYIRTNPRDNTGDWFSKIGSLGVAEQHSIAYDSNSNILIAGAQDNGTAIQTTIGGTTWSSVASGDGGDVAVDDVSLAASHESIRYFSSQELKYFARAKYDSSGVIVGTIEYPDLEVDTEATEMVPQFVTPVVLNAVTPTSILFVGENSAYESLNQGDTITEIADGGIDVGPGGNAVAYGHPADARAIYLGRGAQVMVRIGDGDSLGFTAGAVIGGGDDIRDVVLDSTTFSANTAFVVDQDQVFETRNGGISWAERTGNLAALGAIGMRSLAFIPGIAANVLLVGTGAGVYFANSTNYSVWTKLGTGLPNVPVFDLEYDAADDVLVAGTLGRGAWTMPNVSDSIAIVLQIVGTSNADTFRIVRKDNDPLLVQVFINNTTNIPNQTIPLSALARIDVDGLAGGDSLEIDSTYGVLNVPEGIHYMNDPSDRLTLTGSNTDRRFTGEANDGINSEWIVGYGGFQTVYFDNSLTSNSVVDDLGDPMTRVGNPLAPYFSSIGSSYPESVRSYPDLTVEAVNDEFVESVQHAEFRFYTQKSLDATGTNWGPVVDKGPSSPRQTIELASPQFSAAEFIDLAMLITRLRSPAPLDTVSQFLWAQFGQHSAAEKIVLADGSSSQQALESALVIAMNNVLLGPSIYDASVFMNVTLSARVNTLKSQNPQGERLILLNRLLLEDAYLPAVIARTQHAGIYRVWASAGDPNSPLVGYSDYHYVQVGNPTLYVAPDQLSNAILSLATPLKYAGDGSLSGTSVLGGIESKLPFGVKDLYSAVDLSVLFQPLVNRMSNIPAITATQALVSSSTATFPDEFNPTDVRFVVSGGGLAPTEVVVTGTLNANLDDLLGDVNRALVKAGIDSLLKAEKSGDGNRLVLTGREPGKLQSLSLTTLQLPVTNFAATPFGQLAAPMVLLTDLFMLDITRVNATTFPLLPITETKSYNVIIGKAPPAANVTPLFPFTQDNISLADLALDLNMAFMQQELFDVMALVVSTPQPHLVLVSTAPEVTKIEIKQGGAMLGFTNLSVQSTNLPNALGFEPTRTIATLNFDSLESFFPALENALRGVSDPALPADFALEPSYDSTTNSLFFNFRLNKTFAKPTEIDFFDKGIEVDDFGTLEAAAVADANLSVIAKLNFRMGIRLDGFMLTGITPLADLNGGLGVPLLVGLTAANNAPAQGMPGADVKFTLVVNDGTGPAYGYPLTLSKLADPADATKLPADRKPYTGNNTDIDDLISDLNQLFAQTPVPGSSTQHLGDLVQASKYTKKDRNGVILSEKLRLTAVDIKLRGLSVNAPGVGENPSVLGFDPANDVMYEDLDIVLTDTVSLVSTHLSVNLDGAQTVGAVITTIQAQTNNRVSVTIDPVTNNRLILALVSPADQTMQLSVAAGRASILDVEEEVSMGVFQFVSKESLLSRAADGLGIEGPGGPTLIYSLTGLPLDGQALTDRLFIREVARLNGEPKDLTLEVRLDADVTAGAALGTIQLALRNPSPIFVQITVKANLFDPVLVDPLHHRLFLSQMLISPLNVLDLLSLNLGLTAGGSLDVTASITTNSSLLKAIDDPSAAVPPVYSVTLDPLTPGIDFGNHRFEWNVDANFKLLLGQFKALKIDDVLFSIRELVAALKKVDETTLNTTLPSLDLTLNQAIGLADALLDGIDELISTVDLIELKKATDHLETAISNLSLSPETREQLFRGLELLQKVPGSGSAKIPGRLIAVALVLQQLVDEVPIGTGGGSDLHNALSELVKLVPSLNTLEDRLAKGLQKGIRETFGDDQIDVRVVLGFVDYDGNVNTKDRALVVSLKFSSDNLINKTLTPKLPITAEFGALQLTSDPPPILHLHAGGSINIGLGVLLPDPNGTTPNEVKPFLLVADHTSSIPHDQTILTGLKTQLDLNVGFESRVSGKVQFGSLELIQAEVGLSLLKSVTDKGATNLGLAASSGVVTLTKGTPSSSDGRFVIVTDLTTGKVLAWDDYHFAINTANSKLTFTTLPPTSLSFPTLVSVEYQTGIPSQTTFDMAAIDRAADKNNRAKLDVEFTIDPSIPIARPNVIGAVSFAEIGSGKPAKLKADLNGLLLGNVDVELLNSKAKNAVTLAVSLDHVLKPQLVVDTDALGNLLENVEFDFCLIAQGVETLLITLSDGLQSQVMTKLPLLGKNFDMAGTFIGKMQTEFVTPFREFICEDHSTFTQVEERVEKFIYDMLRAEHFDAFGVKEGLGILGDLDGLNGVDPNDVQATLDTQHFEIRFKLHGEDKMFVDFDTALEGLPIKSEGQGGVEFGWSYDVDFGIGVDRYKGFYLLVNENAVKEIRLDIGAGLIVDTNASPPIPTTLTVDLFGLKLTATDILTPTGETGTHIGGMLSFDVIDTNNLDNKNRVYFSEIASQPFGTIFQASASVGVDINLRLAAAINADLPSVQTDFIAKWTAGVNTTTAGEIKVTLGAPSIKFEDLGINLGDFLSKQIGAALNKVDKFIKPLKPLIKALKEEVPGASQLSLAAGKGPLTFLDIALAKNPKDAENARKFVDAVDVIIDLIEKLKTVDGSDDIIFVIEELVNLGDGGNVAVTAAKPAATAVTTPAPPPPTNTPGGLKGILQKLESIGINLEILQKSNIFGLIFHQPFNIISYELPPMKLGPFTLELNFPITPLPIIIRLGFDATLFADLSVGYDSRGIDQVIGSGQNGVSGIQTARRLLDGFYFGDRENGSAGEDIPEFGITLGVRLAALFGVGPVTAGVEGEIQANILANWRDTDGNGKLYLDEIKGIVERDGIECLFDLTGELRAIVRLVYQVGAFKGGKEFINEIIFTFMNHCPKYELGNVTSDGTLILHAGANAGLRRSGATTDVDEDFTVTELAPGVYKVVGMGLESRYSGVTNKIFFDGGLGNDKLLLVDVKIPVVASGGVGDDSLEGGMAKDTLDGGAGNDTLIGHGGADSLSGGANNDLIYGDPSPDDTAMCVAGNDTIHGDAGNDLIFGDLGVDSVDGGAGNDMIFGQDGDDVLRGGSGEDRISGGLGGDWMFGDAGNDVIVGGLLDSNLLSLFNNKNPDSASTGLDGSDFVYGGNGNDLLIGDAGNDSLLGGFGNDAIIGYRMLNDVDPSSSPSLIADYIEGGPDNDFICAANGGDTILGGTGDIVLVTGQSGLDYILADQPSAGTPSTGGFQLDSCDTIPVYTEPPVGSIRGQLFSDNDGDTLQQATEPGLNVWTVNLLDDQNAVVATQITANMDLDTNGLIDPQTESGWYSFAGVDPGAYHIQAVLMPGFVQTTTDQMLTVNDGQVVLNGKIGERFQPGEITGRKFEDSDGDGSADLLERGVNGWEMQLLDQDGNVLDTQMTKSVDLNGDLTIDPVTESGLYSFTDLVPGTYTVSESPRAGWVQSFPQLSAADVFLPITDDGYSLTKSGALVTGLNGPIAKVIVSLNVAHSDVQQLTATLVSPTGTQVRLFQNVGGDGDNFTGTLFDDASTVSIAAGVAPFITGSFKPEVSLSTFLGEDPNGVWKLILEDDLEEDVSGRLESWSVTVLTTSEIANGIGGLVETKNFGHLNSYQINVTQGGVISGMDFGNFRVAELRGVKFEDLNGNGLRERNENGLAGVEIYVDLNKNGQWDREEPKTLTQSDDPATEDINETGTYELKRLPPSPSRAGSNQPVSYSVKEVLQPGWVQSFPGTASAGSPQLLQSLASSSSMPTITISPVSVLEGNSGTTLAVFTVNLSAASMDPLTVNYVTHNGTASAGSDYAAASGSLVFAPGTTSMSFSVVVFGDIQSESNETFIVSVGFPDGSGGTDIRAEIVGTIRNDEVSREIHGQKFEDLNANGVHDAGEPGLNGWTIQLVIASAGGPVVVQSTTTADIDLNQDGSINPQTERGLYQFNDLAAGTYLVREVLQPDWFQSAPGGGSYTVIVPGDALLYTVTNTNELAAIDVVTHSVVIIGVTRDSAVPPVTVRRIRGLAYDSAADILYGMTREGDLVKVNRTTGQTTPAVSLITGNPANEFWSGLAFDGANNFYTTNASSVGHELVRLTRNGTAFVETIVGNTTIGAGSALQIVGLDFYPASAPAMPVTFNGTHPTINVLYGSIRAGGSNIDNNIVVLDAASGAATTLLGQTTDSGKIQEIAFHPVTGELYSIHDQGISISNNALLSVFDFTAATSVDWGELPFGIREDSIVSSQSTLGWGGLAFATPPATNAGQSYDFANYQLIYLPDGDDVINAGGGNDLVHGDNLVTNPLVVSIGSRRDSIFGEGGMDSLFGQEANDVLSGGSDGDGTPSDDRIDGGEGTGDCVLQEVDADQTLVDSLLTGEGMDRLFSIERATLIGGASANAFDATSFMLGSVTLIGKGGNDTLKASAADDVLKGDEGDDSLDGSAGNDRYVFVGASLGADTIFESADLNIDTLDFSGFTQTVAVDLNLSMLQTVNASNLDLVLGDATAIENVIGSSFNDTIQGNNRENLLIGGSGDDTVSGGFGNDTVRGNDDNDELHGEFGDDVMDGGNGNDRLFGGTGDDVLTGGLGDDFADGSLGNDTLSEGGSGDFTLTDASLIGVGTDFFSALEAINLFGDAGPNRFIVSHWSRVGTLNGAGGNDTVISNNDANLTPPNASITLTNSSLSVSGGATFSLINIEQAVLSGGSGDNAIDASAFTGTTTLSGNAGRDTLRGGSGSDLLIGGTDNDQLIGNAGDDAYQFAVAWGADTVVELPGQGFDTVDFSVLFTSLIFTRSAATLFVSDLTVDDVTHTGNDIESLIGGGNNDVFRFANGVSLAGGAGRVNGQGGGNTLDYRAFTTSVFVNLTLQQAPGLSSLQNIQEVLGGSADDLIIGNGEDNYLYGFDGNDVLEGGKGNDNLQGGLGSNTLNGGGGDDLYFVEDRLNVSGIETDLLREDQGLAANGSAASGGIDTISLKGLTHSVVFNLGNMIALQTSSLIIQLQDVAGAAGQDNFENVLGSFNYSNDIMGNAADNNLWGGLVQDTLAGGDGNDTLRGYDGSDDLSGGAGDDVYFFEPVANLSETDLVREDIGLGIDTLNFNSLLVVNDMLAGDDTVFSLLAGDDLTLDLAAIGTLIGMHNNRTILTAAAGQAANFENVFGGGGNDHLTGNATNNHLQGNDGNDVLSGGDGQDLLEGGEGDNSFNGGNGNDTLVGGTGINTFVDASGNNVILDGISVVVAQPQFPNAPQLMLAYNLAGSTVVQGLFHGRPLSDFTLSFFDATNAATPLHTVLVTTDINGFINGNQQFTTMFSPVAASGTFLKATTTDVQGNKSQLSNALLVQASVDLAVVLTVDNAVPLTGSTIHYSVSVNNAGANSATDVIVTDRLPTGVTFVSASPTSGVYDAITGVWSVGTVASSASQTLTITATVDVSAAGQIIVNTAVATVSNQVDTTAGNNSDDVDIKSPLATILGRKFADSNGNGIKDAGEAGLAGWVIEVRDLLGNFVAHTATLADDSTTVPDETGMYSIELPAGAYKVFELSQPGWVQTLPAGPSFAYTVTLTSGQTVNDRNFGNRPTGSVVVTSGQQTTGQDFGNFSPGSIHGFKFEDWDGDGHYDVGVEPRLANVQFTLTATTGPAVQVMTNLSGEFEFTGLPPGSYTVAETVPTGYTATTPTSFTRTLRSGDELVAYAGQAKLPADDPRHEVVLGQPLMFGNLPDGVDLEVVKTVSANPVIAGSGIKNLTYLVTVTNRGPVNATGVTLSEDLTLPSGVTLVSVTPSKGTRWSLAKTPDGTWNVGNLLHGASATLTVVLTVSGSAASGTNVIRNIATVTASNQRRYHTSDDSATVNTSISRVDLVVQLPDIRNTVVVSRTGSGDAALLRVMQGKIDLITPTRINTVGSLRIEGGNAADDVTFDTSLVGFLVGTLQVNGNGGNDRLNAAALHVTSALSVLANAAIRDMGVSLNGGDGDDTLSGGDGPDVLNGGAGNDVLAGNLGNDSLTGGSGTDRLIESADANLTLTNTSLVGLGLDVLSGFESAQLTGGKGKNALNASGFSFGPVMLFGSDGDDTLTGTGSADVLDGGAGNDSLIALGENDSLTGGAGNDVLNGGEGSDVVVETANVNLTLSNSALAGIGTDMLLGIERAFLTGGAAGNKFDAREFTLGAVSLVGLGGNDTLMGGTGDDTLTGDLGNDSLVGGAGKDRLVEIGDVNFMLTIAQLIGLGTDTLASIEEVSLTGGAGNNTLTVRDFAGLVTLRGAAGNDTLIGGAGNDVLEGDLGDDQLTGGAGDDQLNGDAGTDVVVESGSAAYTLSGNLLTGTGMDVLMSIELVRLTLSNAGGSINASAFTGRTMLTGGTGSDSIIGGTGDDLLVGGDGADTLEGNAGNDTLTGGLANDSLNGGGGDDLLSETADVASLVLTDTALVGLGSDVLVAIERALLTGGAATNTFDASAFTLGPVTLVGGAANDVLLGGSGADLLDGGLGNDTLKGNLGGDTLLGGEGLDSLEGGDGADSLNGQLGNDTLLGGAGNDTLTGEAGNDSFDGGLDTDRLSETVNINLVLNATQLTGLGTDTHTQIEAAFLTGGAGANKFDATLFGGVVTLIGAAGDDVLIGGANADSLDGGDGNDSLTANAGADTIQGGLGNDTALAGDGNDQVFGGAGGDSLDGGAGNDSLDGGNDKDKLLGGIGNDTLSGGLGADTLDGGADNDVLDGEADTDSLIGGTGRDLLIGGAAIDTLAGGTDEDILIGGTTSYSGNAVALTAIMAEWTSTNPYPTRIANLLSGGGANGSTVLNATTVQNDNNAADKINGSLAAPNNTDLDWFFQSAGDVLDAINGEVRTTI